MPLNLDPRKQMERASYLQSKACLPSLIQVCLLSLQNMTLLTKLVLLWSPFSLLLGGLFLTSLVPPWNGILQQKLAKKGRASVDWQNDIQALWYFYLWLQEPVLGQWHATWAERLRESWTFNSEDRVWPLFAPVKGVWFVFLFLVTRAVGSQNFVCGCDGI